MPFKPPTSLPAVGFVFGARAALAFSWCYINGVGVLIAGESSPFAPGSSTTFSSQLTFLIFVLIFGCAVGMVPALLIGSASGWLLGLIVDRAFAALSRDRAVFVGTLCCGAIALLLTSAYCLVAALTAITLLTDPQTHLGYWLFLGIPSMIYLAVAGWASDRLYCIGARARDAKFRC